MRNLESPFYSRINRLPFNLMMICLVVYLLYPVDRLTDANLAQLHIGMPMAEAVSMLGSPITEQGYRVGVSRLTCFGGPYDFQSDEEGENSSGGGLRIGYVIVPASSWANTYIIREVPKDRPSAVKNPALKVWVNDKRCLWLWSGANGLVTHLVVLPVEVSEGWRDKYESIKFWYELDGWSGVIRALRN